MPRGKVKARGGSKRTVTVHPKGRKDVYMTCDVVRKPGKRGGKTVCSKPKHKKK